MLPLIGIAVAILLATNGIQFPFFCYNMIVAIGGIFFTLLIGAYTHSHRNILSPSSMCLLFFLESIAGITFPLLPVSVLVNFILLQLNQNLFSQDNYTFGCLGVANAYLLGVVGLVAMSFHNYFDLDSLYFPQNMLRYRARFFGLLPFFQSVFQVSVLVGYFLFSEDELPMSAVLGIFSLFIFESVNLLYILIFTCISHNFQYQVASFKKRLKSSIILRALFLGLGVVVGALLLWVAQRDCSVFSAYPHFSLAMLLALFSFVHHGYSVLPLQY